MAYSIFHFQTEFFIMYLENQTFIIIRLDYSQAITRQFFGYKDQLFMIVLEEIEENFLERGVFKD